MVLIWVKECPVSIFWILRLSAGASFFGLALDFFVSEPSASLKKIQIYHFTASNLSSDGTLLEAIFNNPDVFKKMELFAFAIKWQVDYLIKNTTECKFGWKFWPFKAVVLNSWSIDEQYF